MHKLRSSETNTVRIQRRKRHSARRKPAVYQHLLIPGTPAASRRQNMPLERSPTKAANRRADSAAMEGLMSAASTPTCPTILLSPKAANEEGPLRATTTTTTTTTGTNRAPKRAGDETATAKTGLRTKLPEPPESLFQVIIRRLLEDRGGPLQGFHGTEVPKLRVTVDESPKGSEEPDTAAISATCW
ncbi:hypothetical protein CSOJ01_02505 [Colletotrichum sojae]|uniref:Uncharacterized protein n=1 Tax=Colletotrichum sojae TaxID=2175907 RepID=A0A8H6N2P2_9PEZI|nr:hypothetical protein CSOJ01_02505 [Colletotrichum sojae]